MIANDPAKRPVISEVCAFLQEKVKEDITVYPGEDELHRGQLSVVYKKKYNGKFRSVKRTSTANEVEVMKVLDHCNVVKFFDCVLIERDQVIFIKC
jgi:hypothetical protein